MRLFDLTAITLLILPASAGPISCGICQAGCAAVVTACYSAAGATWGATLGATAPATVIGCNTAFGICQAACAAAVLAPCPQVQMDLVATEYPDMFWEKIR